MTSTSNPPATTVAAPDRNANSAKRLSPEAETVFAAFDDRARGVLLTIRDMIFDVAAVTEDAGQVVEQIRWGQPSFATRPKTGTPMRLGVTDAGHCAIFVHCQSRMMADAPVSFAALTPMGARGVEVRDLNDASIPELRAFIRAALTYHLWR